MNPASKEIILEGLGVSPGIAVGQVHLRETGTIDRQSVVKGERMAHGGCGLLTSKKHKIHAEQKASQIYA